MVRWSYGVVELWSRLVYSEYLTVQNGSFYLFICIGFEPLLSRCTYAL